MRYFFRRSIPPFSRVLLVESGSRQLFENLLPTFYENHPGMQADLVTCYAGAPKNFRADQGSVYRVTDYPDAPARRRFVKDLAAQRHSIAVIICSAEPIMARWKWMLAARLPVKVLVLNENGDYFWIDRAHLSNIRYFILFRAGLTGAGAVRTLARVVLFPFSLLYLILYAATIHLRRALRSL